MLRHAPWLLALLLALGLGLKFERARTQPLAPQAAAVEEISRGLRAAGWLPLGAGRLLADGSLAAEGFQLGACHLEVALLTPGREFTAVLREAWGERAQFLHGGVLRSTPPEPEGRLRNLARHMAASLGLGLAPPLFGLAIATEGDCAGRLPLSAG